MLIHEIEPKFPKRDVGEVYTKFYEAVVKWVTALNLTEWSFYIKLQDHDEDPMPESAYHAVIKLPRSIVERGVSDDEVEEYALRCVLERLMGMLIDGRGNCYGIQREAVINTFINFLLPLKEKI
jgi:hypothetical protein